MRPESLCLTSDATRTNRRDSILTQDDRQHSAASERNPARPTFQAMVPYTDASDEIDLVDVGVSLWRRWKLMLAVFLVCIGLSLTLAFIIPKKYNYSTTIQIGTQVVGDKLQPIEPPDSAAKKIENGFLPELIQTHARLKGINPKELTFSVNSPLKTNLVVISGEAPDKLAEEFRSIETAAAQALINSELPLTKVMRAKLESDLADAQASVRELEDPKYKKLLQTQITSLEDFKKRSQQQQLASSHHVQGANDALTSLLLGTQVQQADTQLSDLQQTLQVKLPGQIASAKAKVSSIKAEIDNLQSSQIVAGPLRSASPTGLPRSIIAILGAVIGLILALLAATGANYISAVPSRIKETN